VSKTVNYYPACFSILLFLASRLVTFSHQDFLVREYLVLDKLCEMFVSGFSGFYLLVFAQVLVWISCFPGFPTMLYSSCLVLVSIQD
jgi:hypothetical protein